MADPMNRIIEGLNDAIDWSSGKTTTRIHAYGKTYEFTRAEYDAFLLGRASSPAPSRPTREEIARVVGEETIGTPLQKADRILALFAQPQEKKAEPFGWFEPYAPELGGSLIYKFRPGKAKPFDWGERAFPLYLDPPPLNPRPPLDSLDG